MYCTYNTVSTFHHLHHSTYCTYQKAIGSQHETNPTWHDQLNNFYITIIIPKLLLLLLLLLLPTPVSTTCCVVLSAQRIRATLPVIILHNADQDGLSIEMSRLASRQSRQIKGPVWPEHQHQHQQEPTANSQRTPFTRPKLVRGLRRYCTYLHTVHKKNRFMINDLRSISPWAKQASKQASKLKATSPLLSSPPCDGLHMPKGFQEAILESIYLAGVGKKE